MPDASARLGLPRIAPSQAQKHVTHNEALELLDALVHLTLQERGVETPPAGPQPGQCWGLGAAPTGDWAGQGGRIARWDGSGWQFLAPVSGLLAWDVAAGDLMVHDGTAWMSVTAMAGGAGETGGAVSTQNLDGVGIGTTSDATNRLAVSAAATLLSHEGASHQVKINKAAAADTASLLFQSGWIGHAEVGLTGDTGFAVKVSADGLAWTTALTFDPASGRASGQAVQQSATDTTPGRLATVGGTYGPGNLIGPVTQAGGMPTGAVVERGQNANGSYVRWADGTQICWSRNFVVTASNEAVLQAVWTYSAAFAGTPAVSMNLSLVNSDWTGVSRSQVSTWGPITAPTITNVKLAVYPSSGTGTVTGSVSAIMTMAFGRWF